MGSYSISLGGRWKNNCLPWPNIFQHIASSTPQTEPGSSQQYHSLSLGWLCGGLIEHASGKKFQEVLDEAIVGPLYLEGELYIGIPPGDEWTNFLERRKLPKSIDDWTNFVEPSNPKSEEIAEEHRLWAPYRGQTLSRKVWEFTLLSFCYQRARQKQFNSRPVTVSLTSDSRHIDGQLRIT